jgi:dolichyl-phosphate-mannose--protein O-mannosyl transferase
MRFPTYHWDAFTHWNRRAQQFSQAGTLLMEGTSKPHYPILTHAMGVMTALPAGWDDKMANVANALLSVTLLGSVFLVVRRTHGMMTAAVLLPLLAAMPIAAVHLRGGMADLPVACFAVLAGVLLDRAWRTQERRTLLLSALMITAAAWTKLDGFYGGVLPWCIACFLIGRRRMAFVPLLLSLPWFIFISLADLPLSPNAAQFGFHPEAPWLVFEAMFLEMSFGMRWWAAVIVVGILVVRERWALLRDPLLQFGFIALSATIVNFVMTSDVLHLVTKVTFSRAMLTATFLLTAGLTLRFGNLVRAYTVSDKRNHQG